MVDSAGLLDVMRMVTLIPFVGGDIQDWLRHSAGGSHGTVVLYSVRIGRHVDRFAAARHYAFAAIAFYYLPLPLAYAFTARHS